MNVYKLAQTETLKNLFLISYSAWSVHKISKTLISPTFKSSLSQSGRNSSLSRYSMSSRTAWSLWHCLRRLTHVSNRQPIRLHTTWKDNSSLPTREWANAYRFPEGSIRGTRDVFGFLGESIHRLVYEQKTLRGPFNQVDCNCSICKEVNWNLWE